MKKLGLFIAAGLMIGGLSSCVKDYECKCVTTFSDGSDSQEATQTVKGTKKTSEVACDALDGETNALDVTATTECSI